MRRNKTSGLTLFEFIIIIVIIGILTALVISKFIHMSSNSQKEATSAIAGALSTANASNYAARKLNPTFGVPVINCTDVQTALEGGLPANYTIVSKTVAMDATISCTLTGPSATKATFSATGIT